MKVATKVVNPTHRAGRPAFCKCTWCGFFYTSMGISRHWPKCPQRPSTDHSVALIKGD